MCCIYYDFWFVVAIRFIHNSLYWNISSDAQSYPSLWPHGLQHAGLPHPSPTPRVCSNSCPSSGWCHPTISSSVITFSSCLQSFPESGSFLMSQFFASGDPSIRASNEYSGLIFFRIIGLISLLSKGFSRVFSSTTVWKHQFFGTQPSLWSSSHICTWLLGKP